MRERLGRVGQLSGHQWLVLSARILVFLVVWVLVAAPASLLIFTKSSRSTVIASHDAVVSPAFDGYATLDLGPYLPKLRYPSGSRLGAQIDLGKTNVTTYSALIERYAFIGSQPEGQIAKVRSTLTDIAVDSAISGSLLGLAVPATWLLLGRRRRAELFRHFTVRRMAVAGLAALVAAIAIAQPWNRRDPAFQQGVTWQSISSALPDVPIPEVARPIEVESGLITTGTRRLAESAFDTYTRSLNFYRDVVDSAEGLSGQLHQPAEDEVVGLLVSDRHDNVGMDGVARAIADQGGATFLMDAGDDTSTGSSWEAFSLESLNEAFEDFDDRFSIAGNHDHGEFVSKYFAELGFTALDGEVVEGPDGIRILGVNDPRSSGLGSWRDEPGVSFSEHREQLADLVCRQDEEANRVNTLLVHDANSGNAALERGCVDLVLGGHVHSQLGPTLVTGENGRVGYSYTNGTTGGAAYAVAIGSKLRRDAQVTLVTYRDGRPVGIQPVTVRPVGDFVVGEYTVLDLGTTVPGPEEPSPTTGTTVDEETAG